MAKKSKSKSPEVAAAQLPAADEVPRVAAPEAPEASQDTAAFFADLKKKRKKKKTPAAAAADADADAAPADPQPLPAEPEPAHDAPLPDDDAAGLFADMKKKKKKNRSPLADQDEPADQDAPTDNADAHDTLAADDAAAAAAAADDDLFAGSKKKKKKKVVINEDLNMTEDALPIDSAAASDFASAAPTTGSVTGEDALIDATFGEKKKKKKKKIDLDEFAAALRDGDDAGDVIFGASSGMGGDGVDGSGADGVNGNHAAAAVQSQDSWAGTNRDYTYAELLGRVFKLIRQNNPELQGEKRKINVVAPQVLREGSKKTLFANLVEFCRRIRRTPDHLVQFMFAELGTTGSIDGNQRLVIKGRFQQKQIENVLKRYIVEYVTCKTCKSADTILTKENRLFFLQCESCSSSRSVSAIKTGFMAQTSRRAAQRNATG